MIVSLAILAAATTLCAIGKLQSDAVIAIYGAAIGLLGGNAQSLGSAAINGGPKPDLNRMADRSAHDAMVAAGAIRQGDVLPADEAHGY